MKVQELIHLLCRLPIDTEVLVCRKEIVGYLEDNDLQNTVNLLILAEQKYV